MYGDDKDDSALAESEGVRGVCGAAAVVYTVESAHIGVCGNSL